jgi:hypothetical protein
VGTLTAPKVWRRASTEKKTRLTASLSPEEAANVRKALVVLRYRLGSLEALAHALKVEPIMASQGCMPHRRPSAGLAIRAARAAEVPVEEILAGRWPGDGACPLCGRTG